MTLPSDSIAVGQDEIDKGSPSGPLADIATHVIAGKHYPIGLLADETGHIVSLGALVTSLNGYVDGLEGYTDGIETLLTALSGYVDGLEGLLSTLSGYVDGLETLLAAASDPYLGKTPLSKSVDFSASQTGQVIWTPTSGTRFNIVDYEVSFSAAGTLTIFDNTDDLTNRVGKWYGATTGGAVRAYRLGRKSAALNNVLKYTTGAGAAGSITVNGYES